MQNEKLKLLKWMNEDFHAIFQLQLQTVHLAGSSSNKISISDKMCMTPSTAKGKSTMLLPESSQVPGMPGQLNFSNQKLNAIAMHIW